MDKNRERTPAPSPAGLGKGAAQAGWVKTLVGRLIERACTNDKAVCPNEACRFWTYCKCAREQQAAAAVLETRLWMVLGVCGALAIVYWLAASHLSSPAW